MAGSNGIPATPTTDFALIQAQKENIVPLSTGRSAAILSNVLTKDRTEADRMVHEGHEWHKRLIEETKSREAEGDELPVGVNDVLDPYCSYIAFIMQHHPSSPQHLLPILESTSRSFLEDTRFQQDLRYLKIWAQYARLVERSDDVWTFLNSREVGTVHALFYEEWALAAESKGKMQIADEIYRLGVGRKAQPLKRLQTSYQGYKNRAARIPDETPVSSGQPRTALAARLPSGQIAPVPLSQSRTSILAQPGNGAKLDVFSDTHPTRSALDQREGEWTDVGTREGNRKENFLEAMPWKGETMKQDKTKVTPRIPKMSVFSDVDEDGFAKPPPPAFDPLKSTAGKEPKKAGSKSGNSSKSKSTKTSSREKPTAADEGQEVVGKGGKIEKRMFPWDRVFRDGEEFCFEELRVEELNAASGGGTGGWGEKEVRDWELEWHTPSQFSPVKPKVIERRPPSPTVNTKAAMAEVFELFNQTLSVGRRGPTAIDENDEDDDSENDDDSDDDDDEEDDEDMKTHAVPPTPLPMPGTAPRLGMGLPTPSKIVPATPTPAQGYLSGKGKTPNVGSVFIEEEEELAPPTKPALAIFSDSDDGHQKPAVFSDENAPISVFADENAPRPNPPRLAVFSDENQIGTSKSDENTVPTSTLRTSVFGQTPMKTPLSVRPLAPVQTHSENTESPERQHSSVFIDQRFTTPLPSRRVFTSAPLESSKLEPADHEQHEAAQDGNMYSYQETLQDENSYNPNPRRIVRCGGAFDMMTPITERTCEYTQSTQAFTLRSSTSSALTQSQRRAMDEDDDFDDEEYQEQPTERDGLSMVQEESESAQVSRRNGLSSRETTPVVPFDEGTGGPASQRSNASDSLFQLSPGHTIHKSELPTAINTTEAISHPVEQKDPAMSHIVIPGQVNRSESRAPGDMSQELSMPATVAEPETIMHHPDKLMVPMQSLPSPTDEAVVSFNPPNPCCPTDPDVIQPMIAALSPPVAELNNFVDLRATRSEQLEDLQKNSKSRGRRNSSSTGTKGSATEPWLLNLHGRKFEIEEKVGEGGFGAVFKAIDLAARDAADDASDDEDDETNPEALYTLALKVEKPANVWEAVVLDRIRTRLPEEYHNSIVKSRGLYCYQDESILLLDYYNQGSLLDAVNKAVTWGIGAPAATAPGGLDETLAIFFTIELLRLVEALHRADFIHGDLKIDNCLIRLEESEGWTSQYEMTGENGWASKGIHLIDLGRAIDLRAYPAATAQTFIADWPVDAKDCQEMRDGRPWSYQTDYYGLASICYCMLFGKYISTELAPPAVNDGDQKRYKIVGSFKRYWQTELWQSLFDLLLNPRLATPGGILPVHDELAMLRGQFECWLEENCTKGGRNLKNLLSKVELKAGLGR